MFRGPLDCVSLQLGGNEFRLDANQLAKLNQWLAQVAEKADERHRINGYGFLVDEFKSRGSVYAGASGGNITFSVTPTSLGNVFKVADAITGEVIDLTDYANW